MQTDNVSGFGSINKPVYAKPKKRSRSKSLSGKNTEASRRFKAITGRAKEIRAQHPRMKWKNCIKKASDELYG